MSALEREIVEKFHQLDDAAQRRVRALLEHEAAPEGQVEPSDFDYDQWFRDVESLRQELQSQHGALLPAADVVGILRGIRDGDDE